AAIVNEIPTHKFTEFAKIQLHQPAQDRPISSCRKYYLNCSGHNTYLAGVQQSGFPHAAQLSPTYMLPQHRCRVLSSSRPAATSTPDHAEASVPLNRHLSSWLPNDATKGVAAISQHLTCRDSGIHPTP